jgi:uncharacterized integral membrane protein
MRRAYPPAGHHRVEICAESTRCALATPQAPYIASPAVPTAQPLAHLYDLALRDLDDHKRRADAVRGRLGPVLAATTLGVTLLTGPLVASAHPGTSLGKLALAVAVGSLLVVVVSAFRLLTERRQPIDDLDPYAWMIEFRARGLLDDEDLFYTTTITRMRNHVDQNAAAVKRLAKTFTAMSCAILVMLCGLALAAIVG